MSDDKRRWRHGVNKLTNASFSQLVVQYERLVYTVCFQLVRDAAAAEDLTQETFLSAYLHRDAIPPGYERQWLCRVATNKAKDYLQSAYQRHTLLPGEDNIPPGLSPPAEETVLRRSAAAEIRDLILHMRQPYQPVCRLCLLEEKTPEEPILVLDNSERQWIHHALVKTIHTQLSRGKRMLREALERSGNDDMLSP
jgi:RNA polymerase sigma factor (sigma-70 family)